MKNNKLLIDRDLTDSSSLIRIIQQVQPDEIYNLAAQSHEGTAPTGRLIVAVAPRYFRPTEVETCWATPKAKNKLGWTPKISFTELVAERVREDLKAAERDELVKKHGYKAMDYRE